MTFELLPTVTPWLAAFFAVAGLALVLTVVALVGLARTAATERPTRAIATDTARTTRRTPVASGHVRHA